MTPKEYEALKNRVFDAGYRGDWDWAMKVKPCRTPLDFWREYTWVVCNSGMKFQVAKIIFLKIRTAKACGCCAADVFKHKGKAAAIDKAWDRMTGMFSEFKNARRNGRVVEWCETLPWIGPITKYHLAKNLGVDVAKPDRWLERLAKKYNTDVHTLCARLAKATGERVAAVDVVLWRAGTLGLLKEILNT